MHTSHYSRLEKPTIYRLPLKKDHHVVYTLHVLQYLSLCIRTTNASQSTGKQKQRIEKKLNEKQEENKAKLFIVGDSKTAVHR